MARAFTADGHGLKLDARAAEPQVGMGCGQLCITPPAIGTARHTYVRRAGPFTAVRAAAGLSEDAATARPLPSSALFVSRRQRRRTHVRDPSVLKVKVYVPITRGSRSKVNLPQGRIRSNDLA
jgi:hypothetical protein